MTYAMWLLWGAAAIAFLVTIARAVARRHEGIAFGRLAIVGAIFVAASLLTVTNAPRSSGATPMDADAPATPERLAEVQDQRKQLSEQLAQARRVEQALARQLQERARATALNAPAAPIATEPPAGSGPSQIVILALLALLLLAELAVLLADPLLALLPFGPGRAKREAQRVALNELTELVWHERYAEALARAGEILELKLPPAGRIDLFYLRSYAAVQIHIAADKREAKGGEDLLGRAIKDLREVVEIAPRRGDALYLLALALGFAGRSEDALDLFVRARKRLGDDAAPFAHNESVCLLQSAERHYGMGDMEAAETCFSQVSLIAALPQAVLQLRIKIGMIDLRREMRQRATAAAQAILARISSFSGLTAEQRRTMEVIRIELAARDALTRGNPEQAIAETDRFVADHLPAELPPVDDDVADEIFSPLLDSDLEFPRNVYGGILFIRAVARCQSAVRGRTALSETDVAAIAEPLLRALQIQPRDRNFLAAMGGLYYWLRPELRLKAREWLEAAVTMGVASKYARLILAHDREVEEERRGVLDLFRSTSAKFLRDPSLSAELRDALIDELGRFQEFEPMLISLQGRAELVPREPTLNVLRERAGHLAALIENAVSRRDGELAGRLRGLKADYERALALLEQSAASLETIETGVIRELGSLLVMK